MPLKSESIGMKTRREVGHKADRGWSNGGQLVKACAVLKPTARKAQTRRMGMPNGRAQPSNAPRFSYRFG
jgi:hypothetical protein